MKTLRIIPAADTLLYFPVYLAIDSFAKEFHLVPEQGDSGARVWRSPSFTIRLESPHPDGDRGALEQLTDTAQTDGEIFPVAICDPNILPGDQTRFNYMILSVFIDRVALWCLYKGGRRGPKNRGIRTFLTSIEDEGILSVSGLRLESALAGFQGATTNRAIAKHLLYIESFQPDTNGFGLQEIAALESTDAVLTSSPWLRRFLGKDQANRIAVHNWFPPIPFPFSGLITTFPAWRKDVERIGSLLVSRKGTPPHNWSSLHEITPLSDLLRHLCCSIAFSTSYAGKTIERLSRISGNFRHFGIPETAGDELRRAIIKTAVLTLIKGNYLNSDVGSSLLLWENARRFYENYATLEFFQWHTSYARPHESFYDQIEANEWFWSTELKRLLAKFLQEQ